MQKLVVAGMFSCAAVILLMPSPVSADALDLLLTGAENPKNRQVLVAIDTSTTHPVIVVSNKIPENKAVSEIKTKEYTIKKGDTLTTIAKIHGIDEWSRLFDKNTAIEHPDLLEPDMVITIPSDDEDIKKRNMPAVMVTNVAQNSKRQTPAPHTVTPVTRGSSDGNRYVAGYCTWYVKSRRPDLPNNLGNAVSWVSRAAAQGIATGSTPRIGAVGQRGNHVVFVESVNSDGTVTVSEMNRRRLFEKTTRTVAASYFRYIY